MNSLSADMQGSFPFMIRVVPHPHAILTSGLATTECLSIPPLMSGNPAPAKLSSQKPQKRDVTESFSSFAFGVCKSVVLRLLASEAAAWQHLPQVGGFVYSSITYRLSYRQQGYQFHSCSWK